MKPKSPLPQSGAFTLVEMLMGIAIVLVLALLSTSVVSSHIKKSQAISCLGRLRQVGVIFQAYAGDHQNRVRFLRDGSGLMWFTALQEQAGLSLSEAQKAFGCPSLPWRNVGQWWCYGMRLGYLTTPDRQDPGYPMIRFAEGENPQFKGGTYGFALAQVEQPSQFLLMADSGYSTGEQSFRIAGRSLYSGGGVCLRHQERANALFLDGRVEALTKEALFNLGFLEVLDDEGNTLRP